MKGLFLAEREGHPPPRIVETPAGMLNAIGLQGIGVHRFIAEKMPELRARGAVVIVNICGTTLQEYVELATILSDVEGVAALELNISCPNIKEGGITFGCSLHGTADVVAAVRAATRLPVIPKLTPNVTDISAIAKAAEDAGADAVSLVNTFLAMAIDVETRRPRLSNIVGGLSGPAIRPIAVRMVYECRQKIRIPIIGMGGIATASDVLEFIIAGASAVQVGTANFADPLIWPKLLDGIRSYGDRHRYPRDQRSRRHDRHERARKRMDQLLVALDVDNAVHAIELVGTASRAASAASRSAARCLPPKGRRWSQRLVEQGHRVFLDLKFHDIPHQVAGAVASATKLGVWMMTVHASGGSEMLKAAQRAADRDGGRLNTPAPLIVAVTALTSLDDAALLEIGVNRSMERHVEELAALASRVGARRRRGIAARAASSARAISRPHDRDSGHPRRIGTRGRSIAHAQRPRGARRGRQLPGRRTTDRRGGRSAKRRGRDRPQLRLTIYSKPGCHLCDEMKSVVHRVVAERRAST